MLDKSPSSGVSSVMGVILMVAVVVVLAAITGTYIMDITSSLTRNADASVDFDETPYNSSSNGSLEIQLIAIHNGDYLIIEAPDSTEMTRLDSVGEIVKLTISDSENYGSDVIKAGDVVYVVGVLDGKESVIQTYETKNTI